MVPFFHTGDLMEEKKIQVGGQAVIEGVMMRGSEYIATAVRRKDGTVDILKKKFVSVTKNHPFYSKPIVRGFVSLIEMLKIGFQALNFSANRYELDDENSKDVVKNEKKEKLSEYLTLGVSLLLAFLLFGYLPYFLASLIGLDKQNFLFNIFAGSLRIVFFILYVFLISLMKDVKRVFEYHGAEHKAVFAHENKEELSIENVKPHTTIHPRCGTSFMFFVLLVAILIFSVIDTIVALYWFTPNALIRLIYHLPFLPVISGISYELLKLSDRKLNHPLVKILTIPGMALQRITTQKPDEQQIEIAIIALKSAINEDLSEYSNLNFINE